MILQGVQLFASHFLLYISLSSACQDGWTLRAPNLDKGSVITFQNTTIVGQQESLTWIWPDNNSVKWENTILKSLENGHVEGTLTHMRIQNGMSSKNNILWKINENGIKWLTSTKEIFASSWSLNLCEGLKMKFVSNIDGSWKLKIDDYIIQGNNDTQNKKSMGSETVSRHKRSEEISPPESEENITLQQAGLMECVYDFFFGEADEASGRSEGVFTKVKNWVKNLACRIRGGCEDVDPPPYIPPVPLPPSNPDAESLGEIPSATENDLA